LDTLSHTLSPSSLHSIPLPPAVAHRSALAYAPQESRRPSRASPEDQLARLAASVGPLRRVLAAIAARLVATKAWERLCYARLSDYARERPGCSARQLQDLARVHRALVELPGLEWTLLANELPWSKVRLIARVATAVDLDDWIDQAHALPTRQLEQAVRQQPREADASSEDAEPSTQVRLRCTVSVHRKWSLVHEVAERVAGCRLLPKDALELVVAETCSALSVGGPHAQASPSPPAAAAGLAPEPRYERYEGRAPVARARPLGLPPRIAALATGLEDADAFELDRRLRAAVHLEQTLDAEMAPLLRIVRSPEYEWHEHWCAIPTYARDSLGMSAGKARSLVRLERAGDVCPELRSAYRSGRLSWVKARILLPLLLLDVEGEWRPCWVAWAERVTVRRLEQDVERALLLRAGHGPAWLRCKSDPAQAQAPIPPSERKLCAHDVDVDATEELVFRLPCDVAALFCALLRKLPFEALLDHALETWLLRDPGTRRPDPVIERDGYRCAVPGCSSRRSLHDHHITFRSAQGSDDPENRITLCAFHHQRCLHQGRLRIRGRAPGGLLFELGLRSHGPPIARYRSGDVALPDPEPGHRVEPLTRPPRAA